MIGLWYKKNILKKINEERDAKNLALDVADLWIAADSSVPMQTRQKHAIRTKRKTRVLRNKRM